MTKITVIAKVTAKPDVIEAVQAELLKMLAPTRQEAGCIEYRLHQDNNNPALFAFYENWESMSCLEKHMASKHFMDYVKAVDELLVEKSVNIMTEVV